MPDPVVCDICERAVDVHASYVVRIDVYADPTVPPLDSDTVFAPGGGDFDKTLEALLDEMKHLTADDLQDAVHRRFEYRLCRACHGRFLANPLGKPRSVRVAEN